MTVRDKIGVGVLIGLFVLFGLILWWTVRPGEGPAHSPEDSIFVKQRMINLQKGN
jgi:hypothetical protein